MLDSTKTEAYYSLSSDVSLSFSCQVQPHAPHTYLYSQTRNITHAKLLSVTEVSYSLFVVCSGYRVSFSSSSPDSPSFLTDLRDLPIANLGAHSALHRRQNQDVAECSGSCSPSGRDVRRGKVRERVGEGTFSSSPSRLSLRSRVILTSYNSRFFFPAVSSRSLPHHRTRQGTSSEPPRRRPGSRNRRSRSRDHLLSSSQPQLHLPILSLIS